MGLRCTRSVVIARWRKLLQRHALAIRLLTSVLACRLACLPACSAVCCSSDGCCHTRRPRVLASSRMMFTVQGHHIALALQVIASYAAHQLACPLLQRCCCRVRTPAHDARSHSRSACRDWKLCLSSADEPLLLQQPHLPAGFAAAATLLQGVSEPAHDVFVEEDDVVSSIVVVPLLVNTQHFGGLYVTHEQPWSEGPGFAKAKQLLVGLGALLQRQLGQHVAGQPGAAWVDLLEVRASAVRQRAYWW